ncbi:hypothetical protein [Prauserella flavalba]|uniref:hypothetical protein n=1 Tax=Prauserella flavalba TaxID=1477506 RepID=UPI0036E79421
MEDSFYLAAGRQLWDASLVTARTLILRSEYDFWSRPGDAELLAEHLVRARSVRSVELAARRTTRTSIARSAGAEVPGGGAGPPRDALIPRRLASRPS